MSNGDAKAERKPEKAVSWFDKVNTGVLFLVTPEYADVKRAQGEGYGARPTFDHPAPMPLTYKTIAGVKVRYAHAESAGKPTVVLLNPLPQSIVAFAPIWESLASRFNLYAYDLPGFGGSEGGNEFMTFVAQGEFLRDFISELGIERPHLVGPDIGMGAILAYVTHFPNEVESLAIGDGPGIAPSSNGSIINKAVNSSFWRLVFKVTGAGTFVNAGNGICYLNYVPNAEEVADYIQSYAGRIGPVTEWFKKYPDSLASVDAKLADIDKPVLIFWGADDKLLLVDNAERLHERLQRSKLHVFENCGHFSYQDQHEQFAELIGQWVEGDYASV